MPNVLIYSSGFDGHRQVYVFVISHVLTELNYNIFIAGNYKEKITNAFYIEKLIKDKNITFIDTSIYAQNGIGIAATDFIKLQIKYDIDLTVFAEADHHLSLLNSQILNKQKRLLGRTVGIFLRPFYYYEHLSIINKLRYIKHLKNQWKSDARLFHGILLEHFRLLDLALYIDENFVSHHLFSQWLPDIFQQYAETIVKDESKEQLVWINELNNFKKKHNERFIFLYFGTAQRRRGYDLLLKMAVEQNACFIHCGMRDKNEIYDYDVDEFRRILNNKDRLMETNQYISDPLCIEHFFRSVNQMVLPYRNFWGSSGVMLQALSYGIPVLVPENGIMGYRVKKHNLGQTYNGEYNSLIDQFEKFKEFPQTSFSNDIATYMQFQSIVHLKETLVKAFKV